jgi:glycerol uptake facilitator-like aquaporin
MSDLGRRLAAEALGALLLLAAVVGSGIMAENLTDDIALALLCNALATGAILFVIITTLAPISGAHFNPVVTLLAVLDRAMPARVGFLYAAAQLAGATAGVLLAHAMFDEALLAWGVKARTGSALWLSEAVAVFGLVVTIEGVRRRSVETVAAAIGLYIVAAYWFTASTSFANPAVTLARSLTASFAGIRPLDAPLFIAAQLVGAFIAWGVTRYLFKRQV